MRLPLWHFLLFAMACCPPVLRAELARSFSTSNGLPHNRVNRVLQDSKGFLWVCTDGGLSRFDGTRFVNYTAAEGLPHRLINTMLETRAGDYWVGSDGGISRYEPDPRRKRFTTFTPDGPEDARHVNTLLEEADGSLLLGTSHGLYRFRLAGESAAFERIALDGEAAGSPVMVNAMAKDARGDLYLATNNGLYRRKRDGSVDRFSQRSWFADGGPTDAPAFIDSVTADGEGRVWVAFRFGFGRVAVDGPSHRLLDFVVSRRAELGSEVRGLRFASNGRRWVATNAGLREWALDAKGRPVFRSLPQLARFSGEAITALSEDRNGGLWVGTRRSGLVHLGGSAFETFADSAGAPFGLDQVLLETPAGQVALLDMGGGKRRLLVHREEGGFQSRGLVLPADAQVNTHQMAMVDHLGAWWLSTTAGLFRLPADNAAPNLRLLPTCATERFFEDAAGDVWFSHWCGAGKVGRFSRWERRTGRVHDESFRLPDGARYGLSAFAQDRSGAIWLAAKQSGRLLRLRDGRFQFQAEWPGVTHRLFVDAKGRLWATSTASGLAMIEDPTSPDPRLRRYAMADGLASDEVWSIVEDRSGRIYAGTSRGVSRLDVSTGQVVSYTTADGLVEGDIRGALRDQHGALWFASAHGVSRYQPAHDHAGAPGRPRVIAMRTAGVPVPVSDLGEQEVRNLRLPSHQNSLQIDFAVPSPDRQAPLRYEFAWGRQRFGSQQTPWQDLGAASTIHLLGLSSGDYALQVRAVLPGGQRGEPASVAFSVLEPFWASWWFQLSAVGCAGSAVYWFRTRRLRQELAIERVRRLISMDLHDEIGAGLSRIAILAEAAKTQPGGGNEAARGMLDNIAVSSRKLISEMSDIVWALDPRHDPFGNLADRLRAFGADVLERQGTQWTVDPPSEGAERRLSPALRRQLYLVLREAIHNAAKHAHAGKATLRFSVAKGKLVATLTDDGVGLPAAAASQGAGLSSMARRVEALGGSLAIQGAPGGGTSVQVEVPLTQKA